MLPVVSFRITYVHFLLYCTGRAKQLIQDMLSVLSSLEVDVVFAFSTRSAENVTPSDFITLFLLCECLKLLKQWARKWCLEAGVDWLVIHLFR